MPDNGEEAEQPATLGEVRYRGRSLRVWVLVAGVLALAVSGAFGGLKKAVAEIPTVQAGQAVEGGRFTVTVDRVVAVRDLPPNYRPSKSGGALIGVVATVTLTDDEGVRVDGSVVRLDGVPGVDPGKAPMAVASMREDTTRQPVLQPEVPEQVVFLFDVPDKDDVPEQATVEIGKQRHEQEDVLSRKENWFPDGTAGRVAVKVKDNLE